MHRMANPSHDTPTATSLELVQLRGVPGDWTAEGIPELLQTCM